MYNVKCRKVPQMYQNSLGMMPRVLNIDLILSVPNVTGVPYVPKRTKNDPSVPVFDSVHFYLNF